MSVHSSILFCLSKIRLWWQQTKQRHPDFHLPSILSEFWVCPRVTFWLAVSGQPPKGDAQEASSPARITSTGPVWLNQQQLYSELPLDVSSSKTESNHISAIGLCNANCSGHYPKFRWGLESQQSDTAPTLLQPLNQTVGQSVAPLYHRSAVKELSPNSGQRSESFPIFQQNTIRLRGADPHPSLFALSCSCHWENTPILGCSDVMNMKNKKLSWFAFFPPFVFPFWEEKSIRVISVCAAESTCRIGWKRQQCRTNCPNKGHTRSSTAQYGIWVEDVQLPWIKCM